MSVDPFVYIREQFGKDYDPNADYCLDHWEGTRPVYRRVMNDQEQKQAYNTAVVEMIAELWDYVGKPVDERRLQQYVKQLEILPIGLLEIGIAYAVRNNAYNIVPTVGSIWEGVRNELRSLNLRLNEDIKTAIDEWLNHKFKECILMQGTGSYENRP